VLCPAYIDGKEKPGSVAKIIPKSKRVAFDREVHVLRQVAVADPAGAYTSKFLWAGLVGAQVLYATSGCDVDSNYFQIVTQDAGVDLYKVLPSMSLRAALRHVAHVGKGLAALHESCITHGDVKLENVTYKAGTARLIDFGKGMTIEDTEGNALKGFDSPAAYIVHSKLMLDFNLAYVDVFLHAKILFAPEVDPGTNVFKDVHARITTAPDTASTKIGSLSMFNILGQARTFVERSRKKETGASAMIAADVKAAFTYWVAVWAHADTVAAARHAACVTTTGYASVPIANDLYGFGALMSQVLDLVPEQSRLHDDCAALAKRLFCINAGVREKTIAAAVFALEALLAQ
jgi:serine/threonine protein kinase